MERRILGDYSIIKQIGQGPLGTLFLGEHRFIKKQYALKVLPEELANDRGFIQRFEEEIKVLVTLEHPNIVQVHNVSFDKGVYFLVTDCIVDSFGETTNLGQYMSSLEDNMPENDLVRLLKQVASAIDYIHTKPLGDGNLIHRGLKLNNILLGPSKASMEVFLSDCGLSRIIGIGAVLSRTYKIQAEALGIAQVAESAPIGDDQYPDAPLDNIKLSRLHSSFLQNYFFLAPEQKVIGRPEDITSATDVYAFGVLTYYLISGEFPEGIFDMPSLHRPDLRLNWDWFVTACLHKDYTRRPHTLTEALEELLSRDKVKSAPEPASAPTPSISEPLDVCEKNASSTNSSSASKEQEEVGGGVAVAVEQECEQKQGLQPVIKVQSVIPPVYDPDPAASLQIDPTITQYKPEPVERKVIEPILSEMAVINGGTFYRGSIDGNRDEMPRHRVVLNGFAIDVHPVTNEQFIRFLDAMGGDKDYSNNHLINLKDSRIVRKGGNVSIETGYVKHPVVGVTWYGAAEYVKWVGKRLPSEAEWEIAARGGIEANVYSTGDNIERNQANFFSSDTTSVKSYAPNGYNIYDMAGNVYEWCHDWYGYNYYEESMQDPDQPMGPLQGVYRVLRGGCWKSLKEDLRCSHRHRNNPGTVNRTYGFRCAANVE